MSIVDNQPQSIKLSFIILVWNSEKYLSGCFDSIISKCAAEQIAFEIIAIDNGSIDGSLKTITRYQETRPHVFQLIKLDSNRGTTYPRNLGLKQARGEYLCILDSDTELAEGNLSLLLAHFTLRPRVGMLAPRLLLPDSTVQNSVKRFPTLVDKLRKIPKILCGAKISNSDFYDDFPFAAEREVDTAISACWFFERKLIERVGYFDEKIFYSPEDIDYSIRVWQAGRTILYCPAFTVLHHTQQISHKKPFSKTSLSHLQGLLYYYAKHGGWLSRPQFEKT